MAIAARERYPESSSTPPTARRPCATRRRTSTWSAAGSRSTGSTRSGAIPRSSELEPALELRSYVADVKRFEAGASAGYGRQWRAERDTRVGVLPIGYGDGVRRGLSNNAVRADRRSPLPARRDGVDGQRDRRPRSGHARSSPGAEAVLIGAQADERILAEEVAAALGTINYEVTCGISPRVPREYFGWVVSTALAIAAGLRESAAVRAAAEAMDGPAWVVGGAVRDAALAVR